MLAVVAGERNSMDSKQDVHELAVALLELSGFRGATAMKRGARKFIDAELATGAPIRFWLKEGRYHNRTTAAVLLGAVTAASSTGIADSAFLDAVLRNVDGAKADGAAYALFVQPAAPPVEDNLWNWLVVPIDSLYEAYKELLSRFPTRARNGVTAALPFVDERNVKTAECVRGIRSLAVSLDALAIGEGQEISLSGAQGADDGRTHTRGEFAVRLKQALFRNRVGAAYAWRCAVTNCAVRKVLEAAHLPGRNWREHNRAQDGILLRADVHKLLDAGLARLENGIFLLHAEIEKSEYGRYHGTRIRTLASEN
ncbi:hypothetical protein BLA3211_03402 [Burkholderia aenigmatica]|uniref:HNH nuclease domain-containing protein n=2 Tax=Burkholderiaceae TaxID=119060 RepID=A0A6J5J1R3_9BURK|nr:hypothetical protein BLA3211_03402 [Burkholderia aenigmatica]